MFLFFGIFNYFIFWVFHFFRIRHIYNVRTIKNEIYDIGTEILCKTCFGHNSTQNAPKSMIPVRVCTNFCVDSESAIKTRFKALFKKWHPWICRCCNSTQKAPTPVKQRLVKKSSWRSSVWACQIKILNTFWKMPKFRPVLKYVVVHAEFESKLRFA